MNTSRAMPSKVHELIFDSDREDLHTVSNYRMAGFDLMRFWTGQVFRGKIPRKVVVRVTCRASPPDLMGNPIGWAIISDRLWEHLRQYCGNDVQRIDLPLIREDTGERIEGYGVLNPTRVVDCIAWDIPAVSAIKDARFILFSQLIFRLAEVSEAAIFRAKGFENAILFADHVAKSLRGKQFRGVAFRRARCI